MEEGKTKNDSNKKPWYAKGLLNYKNGNDQTVFKIFDIEMTAPASLKNPGLIYISFIVINICIFVLLKSFIAN
tara:strand:+ start:15911 stop:16129 length:219 start_codon:yes stop_codon:yes gene_type:complete